jgi:hypothetical protein
MKMLSLRLKGYVTNLGQMVNAYRILVENLKGRNNLRDSDVDGWIILKIKLERWG